MAIIKTLDNFDEETELEVNQTNFPCLQALFQIKEAVGATALLETISGGTVTTAALTAGSVSHAKDALVGDAPTIALPQTGTAAAIYFAIGDFGATDGVQYGLSAFESDSVDLRKACKLKDGGTVFTPTAFTQVSTPVIRMMIITPGTPLNVECMEYDGSTFNINQATTPAVNITSITPSTTIGIATDNTEQYMTGFLKFDDGIPSAGFLKEMTLWMYNEVVVNGNKVLYPPLRGRS